MDRLQLQSLLETLQASQNVYFQPPANTQIVYPCIVYKRDDITVAHADNIPYRLTKRYLVTLIDKNPDNPVVDRVAALPMCSYNRAFVKDKLNHDVFILYF